MRYFINTLSLVLASVVFSFCVKAEMPIYAAYISDQLSAECAKHSCERNTLSGEDIQLIINSLDDAEILANALSTSEYEVLIGNATLSFKEKNLEAAKDNSLQSSASSELVLEITTTWRGVPIDDLILRANLQHRNAQEAASHLFSKWINHIKTDQVLEAEKIYSILEASNYNDQLSVPNNIGEFVLIQSALYRDPLQGSISRYSHPQFDDAVVDISVYPFSSFLTETLAAKADKDADHLELQAEMNKEVLQIEALIAQADIKHYQISEVKAAKIEVDGSVLQGLSVEILLNTLGDPVYSTQYLFKQNDKVIKLSGNVPDFMMNKLVAESLPKIKVPNESPFMRSLRAS